MKRMKNLQAGFTYIEAILYISIVSIMLTSLIPFAWNIVEGGAQSAVQQEVSSNARYISERIKYEIRNASAINSLSTSSISLANSNAALNPTIITYTSPNVTIKQGVGATANLNSNDVTISSFTFTNNTSGDNKTKNISYVFVIRQAYSGSRADFKFTTSIQSSAEIRSN
jgi:type II secretory pathway pseudopilin PulG